MAAAVPLGAAALPAPQTAVPPGSHAQASTASAGLALTAAVLQEPDAERRRSTDGPRLEFAITHMPPLPSRQIPEAGTDPGMRVAAQPWPS